MVETKKQLIERVLEVYKKHFNYIQTNFQNSSLEEIKKYLSVYDLDCGICCYIFCHSVAPYRNAGYGAKWVKKYNTSRSWGKYPRNCHNFDSILLSLKLRIDNMEEELRTGDNLNQSLDSRRYYTE